MKQINCTINGKATDTPTINFDNGRLVIGQFENPQRVIFKMTDDVTGGGDLLFGGKSVRVVAPSLDYPSQEGPTLSYAPATPFIYVTDDKRGFRTELGDKWIWGMASDFRLYQMFLHGEDLTAILNQRIAAGANGVRVFGMANYLFSLNPADHNDYYTSLADFAELLAEKGLYLEFTAFADAQCFKIDQQHHWQSVAAAFNGCPNVFLELANECGKNGVDPRPFVTQPVTCLQARGSGLSDEPPPSPAWHYQTFHPRRDWKWPFTVAATTNEIYQYPGLGHAPVVIDEPIGAADHDEANRRSCNPVLFEKMAVDCALWAGGGTFHSEAGLSSALWSDTQYACAEAFFRGLKR